MDAKSLWKQRANEFWNMAVRYLRYIGNSGFLFSVYVAIILGSYYYGKVIQSLPDEFPTVTFMTIFLFFFVFRGKIRTFMKEPDSNFLIPLERRFTPYFQKTLIYSFFMQMFNILLVLLALGPLYFARVNEDYTRYFASILLILLLAGWNMIVKWEELKVPDGQKKRRLPFIRGLVILVTLFVIFNGSWLATAGMILVLNLMYLLYYRKFSTDHTIKWDRLIEQESSALMFFYRIANMFVEVPQISQQVKKRKWANTLVHLLNRKSDVFAYMYTRAFFRSDVYFGIYVRLTVIGVILLYFLPGGILLWAVNVLLIYMTAIQLTTMWPHFDMKVWVDLYPVSKQERYVSFQTLLVKVLSIQLILFTIADFLNHFSLVESVITLLTGGLLIVSYIRVLLYKQLNKRFIMEH